LTARQAHYAAMIIKTFLLFVVIAVAEITGCPV
jgi:hypothetical protein